MTRDDQSDPAEKKQHDSLVYDDHTSPLQSDVPAFRQGGLNEGFPPNLRFPGTSSF
ncbi:MAG: hypothetical protein OSB09_07785 [Planctomycetota bacterium]|nr:hypothetical protein [Planctomycetota bacterium]